MFEKPIKYPCAISDQTDEGALAAYQWLRSKITAGDECTLWVPRKRTLQANDFLRALSTQPSINIIAKDEILQANGVILAMYPDTDDLSRVTGAKDTRALAVVCWADDLQTWAQEVGAEVVHVFEAPTDYRELLIGEDEPELTPEVIAALERITTRINHDNTIGAGGFDKDVTISELLKLHREGAKLPPKRMAQWAIAHGWQRENPRHLREYAAKINSGSRPRVSRRFSK